MAEQLYSDVERFVGRFGSRARDYAHSRWKQVVDTMESSQELSDSDRLDKSLSGKLCDNELVERLKVSKPGDLVWTRRIGGDKLWDFYLLSEKNPYNPQLEQATREVCGRIMSDNVMSAGIHAVMIRVPNNEGRHVYAIQNLQCSRHQMWDWRQNKYIYGNINNVSPMHHASPYYHYNHSQDNIFLVEIRPHNQGDRTAFASFMNVHSSTGGVKATMMAERVHSVLKQHRVHAMHQLPMDTRTQLEKEHARYQNERIAAQLNKERLVMGAANPQEELKARVAKRNEREYLQLRSGVRVHEIPETYRIHQGMMDAMAVQGDPFSLRVHMGANFRLHTHYTDEMPGIQKGRRAHSLLRIHETVHTAPSLSARERAFLADTGPDGYRAAIERDGVVDGNASDAMHNYAHVQDALGDYDMPETSHAKNAVHYAAAQQRHKDSSDKGQGRNIMHP